MYLIGLERHALQRAGLAGSHSSVEDGRVTSESVSEVAGIPPLLQNVLKVIPFLQHRVSVLETENHHTALESDCNYTIVKTRLKRVSCSCQ